VGFAVKQPKKQAPPYKGTLQVPVGRSVVRLKLPPAGDYEIGARAEIAATYKNLPMRVTLVRIEGGWDVVE
jgi:hypothetical protein